MLRIGGTDENFFYRMNWEECNNCIADERRTGGRDCRDPQPETASYTRLLMLPGLLSRVADVAKRYLVEGTARETYFSDIEMQMISKRYARMYTAMGPPKKVDFLQVRSRALRTAQISVT